MFIPLLLMLPEATVPIVQVSLLSSLDPEQHIRLGQALASLREQGVFIVGSGMSYHNMRGFQSSSGTKDSVTFNKWLTRAVCDSRGEDRCAEALRSLAHRNSHLVSFNVFKLGCNELQLAV